VLLECGPELGNALMSAGYIDELITYISPVNLEAAGKNVFAGGGQLPEVLGIEFKEVGKSAIGADVKSHYILKRKGE
jgi:dihydrofolate reductase